MSSIKRPLQRIALGFFLFLFVFVLMVWVSSPYLVRTFAKQPLGEYGLILEEGSSVSINPFATKVEIRELRLLDENKDVLISVAEADLDVALLKLFSNHLHFDNIKISGLETHFAYAGGELILGNNYRLPTSQNSQEDSQVTEKSEPIQITIQHLEVSDTQVNALVEQNPVNVALDDLTLSDLRVTPEKTELELLVKGLVNEGELEAKLLFDQAGKTNNIDLDLAAEKFPVSKFSGFLPDDLKAFSGNASFNGTLKILQQPDELRVESDLISVALNDASLVNQVLSVALDALAFEVDGVDFSLAESSGDSADAVNVRIGSIRNIEQSHFDFVDKKLGSEQSLLLQKFIVGPIDTASAESETHFSLKAKDANYLDLDLNGALQPFSEHINGNIEGRINELSLPLISPYLHDALGFGLKSGQIDLNLDVKVEQHQLAGESKLNIRGLEMNASEEQTQSALKDGQAMPLNMALNMLKDGQGNIELDIPVSGDIADPSFGLNSFFALVIKKAIMIQAKNYLINTFVPYANVVTVVMSGAEHLLKVRIEPLGFEAGEAEISEAQLAYLSELASLLKDKPDIQIKTCAISAATDLKLKSNQQVDQDGLKLLRKLSEQRQQNLKRYLVESAGIASSRVLFCEPEFDDGADAAPRIELKTD